MILVPADGYREHLLELRPVDHSEFQGVAVPPVSLVFGEYGVRVRLVDQEQARARFSCRESLSKLFR